MLEPYNEYYRTTVDLKYKDITIKAGFITDGISYKFKMFGAFISKFDPRYIIPVIVHDYLCDIGEWEKANKYFKELLPDTKNAKIMKLGVSIYCPLKYKYFKGA